MPSPSSPSALPQQHTFSPTAIPAPTTTYASTAPIQPIPTAQAVAAALPISQAFDFVPAIRTLLARLLIDAADKDALQAKDLAGEIAAIKRQIAVAKSVVLQVPDGKRSLREQESEIEDVRERVSRLNGLIAALARDCEGQDGLIRQDDGVTG